MKFPICSVCKYKPSRPEKYMMNWKGFSICQDCWLVEYNKWRVENGMSEITLQDKKVQPEGYKSPREASQEGFEVEND
jgi:hypothetical protein